jgi:hypothetical protein
VDSLLLALGIISNLILVTLENRTEMSQISKYLRSCQNHHILKEIAKIYNNPKKK